MANRLANETSPYLLQHAHNPVDWYPWGEEALARARAENKPILLSVGYSACHWCHVMERESFENTDIARIMNENFVNIKVDREERPDIDQIYMGAVQALTGRGGWPMTVFLTPDGRPFYGGTYFPPEDRHGMPGFPRLLLALANHYRTEPADIEQRAGQITAHLTPGQFGGAAAQPVSPNLLNEAAQRLATQFDAQYGGFGGAPKFPPSMSLEFLLRHHLRSGSGHSLEMVEHTLRQMAEGGIYDQLGGGFHRYSVDQVWLVPHFEKMLYDNALLLRIYLHAYQVTGNAFYRQVIEETVTYLLREMTHPDGGFYSSQDADSEGEEGKFFVWTVAEIQEVLGQEEGALIARLLGAEARGNFEGSNVLHRPEALAKVAADTGIPEADLTFRLQAARETLFEARERRIKPGRDDKTLTAWNAMLLRSLAEAATVLEREVWARAAVANAEFLTRALRDGDTVLRTWKDGQAKIPGFLEDYAMLADALLFVHELTLDTRWLHEARAVAAAMVTKFWSEAEGVYYDTAADAETLIVRPRDPLDNATPSGTSVAVWVELKMAALFADDAAGERAARVLTAHLEAMQRYPNAFGEMLSAADFSLGPVREVALIGDPAAEDTRALRRALYARYRPNRVVAGAPEPSRDDAALTPLLAERTRREGKATAYVCEGFACREPVTTAEALAGQLDT